MLGIQRETLVIAAAALVLLLGAGNAQAQGECREATRDCRAESATAANVCRQDCRLEVQDTIAAAQTVCDEQSLDEDACRALIRESVGAVGGECRSECKTAHKEARTTCRQAHQDCRDAFIDPLDDACVQSCREELAPCIDEQLMCHDGCKAAVEDAVAACEDLGLEFREKRMCMHEARQGGHACKLGCHDDSACHGDIRACLSECSVDEPDPFDGEEPAAQRRRGGFRRGSDTN